jgi:predicted glutamine amidotransferase
VPGCDLHLRKSAWKKHHFAPATPIFRYGNVAFAHNGTVYDYKELIPDITPSFFAKTLLIRKFFPSFHEESLS